MKGSAKSPAKTLRTIGLYAALSVGVTVGGVAIGAMVVAPAVARAKPIVQRAMGNTIDEQAPSVGASGSGTSPQAPAAIAQVAPFKPMASALQTEAIIDAAEKLALEMKPAPTGFAAVQAAAKRSFAGLLSRVQRISRTDWMFIDLTAALALGGLVYLRRRAGAGRRAERAIPLAMVAAKPMSSKASRTPRAVVALAESGASPADIARRTRMPLDAVAMCLSLGSMGARQLQPPTA